MLTIHKYTIEPVDQIRVKMPAGAKILTVAGKSGEVFLWAQVDTERPMEARHFSVYGTGWEIDSEINEEYIGTVFVGALVFHVYEKLL